MLITASTIARYRKLADDLDAALERADEIGMELLKSMLPELGEAIEEINEALRGVAELLFEGLRDEAVALHDSELLNVAPRLHLEDKSQWPIVAMQFASEGISSPPPIDFASLSGLNTAYSELEALRKPLDKLRRLALERAPLPSRIGLLRKLRKHDSAKPVWGDQLSTHEETRVLELADGVKRALAMRDPSKLAAFHKELVSAEWSVPIPARLKQDTRGADLWAKLREGIRVLETTAEQLESEFAERQTGENDSFECIERLKRLRYAWLSREDSCRGLLFELPQHPTISRLAAPENFGPRLNALQEKVTPAIEWLDALDRRESLSEHFRQSCNELEMHVETLPNRKDESKWFAHIEKLEGDLQQIAQQLPHLKVSETLPVKVDRAIDAVRHRSRQRSRNRLTTAAVGIGSLAVVVALTAVFVARWRRFNEAEEYLASLIPLAEQGEYVVRPELLDEYAGRYADSPTFVQRLDQVDKLIEREISRRDEFERLLADHDIKVAAAFDRLAERKRLGNDLEEWPEDVFEAKAKYEAARLKGGFANIRTNESGRGAEEATSSDPMPPAAEQRLEDEETQLAEHFERQTQLERGFTNAAIEAFRDGLTGVQAELRDAASDDADKLRKLFVEINELLERAKKPRHSSFQSTSRVPFSTRESAKPLQERLEWVVRRLPKTDAGE